MFLSFVRGLSIVYCAVYLYKKLMNISARSRLSVLFDCGVSVFAGLLCCVLEAYFPLFRVAGLSLIVFVYMVLYYEQPIYAAGAVTVIAMGLSLLCFVFAVMLASMIATAVFLISKPIAEVLSTATIFRVTCSILQIFAAWLPFRIKRFRNGMPFLQTVKFDEPCLFVGIFLIACTMFIPVEGDIAYQISAILAFGMLLFIIWHNRLIQAHLLERAERRAQTVEAERDQLEAEANEAGNELLKQYHSEKRLANAIQTMARNSDATDAGVDSVNVTLRYMAQLAENQHVRFDHPPVKDVRRFVEEKHITEVHLATLLGDLIENALIAVRPANTKYINLIAEIGQSWDAPTIRVYDSGIPFTPETIRKLGIENATTHRADGGSGLGLLVAFDILRTCKATFIIDEMMEKTEYTKSVSVRFDGLNQIRIKTDRPELLEIKAERSDIIFGQ